MPTRPKKKAKRRKPVMRAERLYPEQQFFRRIDDPLAFRRTVLEGSKASLGILKGIYSIKETRERKLEKLAQLHRTVREIRLLIQKAEELMPKYSRQEAIRRFPALANPRRKQEPEKIELPEPSVPKTMTELERLTQSIEKIESKISSLPRKEEMKEESKERPPKEEPKAQPRKEAPARKPEKREAKRPEPQKKEPARKKEEPPKKESPPREAREDLREEGHDDDLGAELGKALDRIHAKLKEL